jgi:hypothetical protein
MSNLNPTASSGDPPSQPPAAAQSELPSAQGDPAPKAPVPGPNDPSQKAFASAPASNPPVPPTLPPAEPPPAPENNDASKKDPKKEEHDDKNRKSAPDRRSAFVGQSVPKRGTSSQAAGPQPASASVRQSMPKSGASGELSDDGIDPTEPLTQRPRDHIELYQSIVSEAEQHAGRLLRHGVLIVGCEHDGCAETASLELMGHHELGDVLLRCVTNHEYKLDTLLSPKWRSHIGGNGSGGGVRNVALLFQGSNASSLEEVRFVLERRGRLGFSSSEKFYVVIQLTGEAWRAFDEKTMSNTVPVWAVNARRHLLARYGTPPEALDSKLVRIKLAQQRSVLPSEEGQLIIVLEQLLIEQKLDALLETPVGVAPSAPPPDEDAIAAELLGRANGVEKAALFVAASFPDLRVGEFELLMQKLLQNLPAMEGATRRQPARSAIAYWEGEQERIIRQFRLGYRTGLDGAIVVEFTFPGLKEAMRNALFAPYQLAQLERLHAAALLLNPSTPRRVVDALVEITARLAPSYPDIYHRDWLMDRLRDIQQWRAEFVAGASRLVQAASSAELDWRALLDQFREDDRAHHRIFLRRLVAMCRGFLANERSARIAHGFLDDLINGTKPDCVDAIEVIRLLRGAPNFDANARLRSLLDFVRVDLRAEIFRQLLFRMRDQGDQPDPVSGWRTIEQVSEWFPQKLEYDRLGEGARWSLGFPYVVWEDYRQWSLEHGGDERDSPVAWLQAHPDLPPPAERISKLAEWLAHPAFTAALNAVLEATFTQHDSSYWDLLNFYFGPRFSVGEAFMADLLSGFYKQSGQKELLDLAILLTGKLPRPLLDKLRVLIRLGADVPPETLRKASAQEYSVLKLRLRRAYDFASHLGGTKTNGRTNEKVVQGNP